MLESENCADSLLRLFRQTNISVYRLLFSDKHSTLKFKYGTIGI